MNAITLLVGITVFFLQYSNFLYVSMLSGSECINLKCFKCINFTVSTCMIKKRRDHKVAWHCVFVPFNF